MSVGHIARALEAAGIPTVVIFIRAFRHQAEHMNVPRALITPHIMGRSVGAPNDVERQQEVVEAALSLLEEADAPLTVRDFEAPYRAPG
jgi:hypothetical protein